MIETELFKEEDIENLKNIENLFVSSWVEFEVDFSSFNNLKKARLTNKKRKNLGLCTTLTELIICKVNKEKDDLSQLSNLTSLDISEGNIVDLNFLSSLNNLKVLKLNYLSKLTDSSGLQYVSDTLEELEIESCKKMDILNYLTDLRSLKKLILSGFKFENIDWVKELPNLEHLSLVDSNVLDGNLDPAKNIDYVGIDNRRHYNYKFDDNTMKIVPK